MREKNLTLKNLNFGVANQAEQSEVSISNSQPYVPTSGNKQQTLNTQEPERWERGTDRTGLRGYPLKSPSE